MYPFIRVIEFNFSKDRYTTGFDFISDLIGCNEICFFKRIFSATCLASLLVLPFGFWLGLFLQIRLLYRPRTTG